MSGEAAPEAISDIRAMVAIDLGAESCRVSLLRFVEGSPKIQLVHRFPNHAVESVDGLHWNIGAILAGLDEGLIRCAGIATEGIRSLAVDGWAVDYVRLDTQGNPVGEPFCYRDERTVVAEASLHERISAEHMRELTGIQLLRLNTVYQMFADDAELRTLPWLNLPEYVLFRLGGRPVSERTNASHTQMLGLDGNWCEDILEELGLSTASMPEVVDPGTDIGQLQGKLASFPAFRDTRLIAPACHDTAAAIAAVSDTGDDWAYISSGTWSLVGTPLSGPNNSPQARAENFTNFAGADSTICFHKNVNGMWLLRQCMESWQADGTELDIAELVLQAETATPADYTLDVDDPDLLLSGRMPQRINAQLHRRDLPELSVHAKDAPAMASLIFHSLAKRYAEVLQSIVQITGKKIQRVYVMGGGSQNDFLNQLTAGATGLQVIKAGTECSTKGNFAIQLAAFDPGRKDLKHPTAKWAAWLSEA